jgi:fucose 4-O-acetylase-like acetyltransferase
MKSNYNQRFEWIDWMKAIGMYLVIYGHFFSYGDKYVYVFHVPLFFIISGFLCKKEESCYVFWLKLWHNLILPILIISTITYVVGFIPQLVSGNFKLISIKWFVLNILFGTTAGFGTCWFVLTLSLLKIIYQYCSSKHFFYFLTVVMLCWSYQYAHFDFSGYPFFLSSPNAVINVCSAYPFFTFGIFCRGYKGLLSNYNNKFCLFVLVLIGGILVYLCGRFNNYVLMYRCEYGDNMLLFLIGGIAGSSSVFALSKLLGSSPKTISTISLGTIVILGFHRHLVDMVRSFFVVSYCDVVFSFIIIVFFVPIILFTERYFPIIIGKYRIKKTNSTEISYNDNSISK